MKKYYTSEWVVFITALSFLMCCIAWLASESLQAAIFLIVSVMIVVNTYLLGFRKGRKQ